MLVKAQNLLNFNRCAPVLLVSINGIFRRHSRVSSSMGQREGEKNERPNSGSMERADNGGPTCDKNYDINNNVSWAVPKQIPCMTMTCNHSDKIGKRL